MSLNFGRTLVLAPHPDDEVLGVGGTMARLAAETEVRVAVVTTGQAPAYSAEVVQRIRAEARAAHEYLGVRETFWLDLPAAELCDTPHARNNAVIGDLVRGQRPDTLFVPFPGDIHRDHREVFESALVAVRPHQAEFTPRVLAYETLSETNWNAPFLTPGFLPNVFIDISQTLERKLVAMARFASQVRPAPHERSLEALRALAILRGSTVHRPAAEAFVLVRDVR